MYCGALSLQQQVHMSFFCATLCAFIRETGKFMFCGCSICTERNTFLQQQFYVTSYWAKDNLQAAAVLRRQS
jgi:hypothetical protein